MAHEAAHCPALHTWPAAQVTPQPPQLRGSLLVTTQLLPHCVVPELGAHRHAPPTHWLPAPHTLPQAPQLLGSNCVKVQVPLQVTCWGRHVAMQLKPLHTWPVGHTRPQAPQLLGSLRDTQALPHLMVPAPVHWHWPAVQVPPAPQVLPQAPHEPGSVCVLVHTPLHVA
jgi:hypothetical protein